MKQVRYVLEAALLGCVFVVFRFMPVDAASAVGGALGRMIGPRLAASRKARRHISLALPERTKEDIEAIVRGMWDNLGRVVAEYPHLSYIVRHRLTVRDEAIVDETLAAGRGAVFFSLHMGNWEIPPVYLHVIKGADVQSMYRAPNNPYVDKMIHHFRTLGADIPAWNKSRAGGQGAMKAVRSGASIAILIDQKYNEGISVPFFGMNAMTNPFFVKLAQKFDVPLVPATLKRTDGVHFQLQLYPPMDVDGCTDEESLAQAHHILEAAIKDTPEQWLWLHRRWNRS